MLTENDVIDKLENHFKKLGCKVVKRNTNQRGYDMEVIHPDGTETMFEVKGETSSKPHTKRFGQPFEGKQIWNHGSVAMMKTIVDMSKPENAHRRFAIGFPENHREMMLRVKTAVDKLGIAVYFVDGDNVTTL